MVMLACSSAYADKKKKLNEDTDRFRYDIEYCKTAADGMVMVKVWSYSKNSNLAMQQGRKNAVHGVIFRGYTGDASAAQYPLVTDPTIESVKADYFNAFFSEEGPYMRYVGSVLSAVVICHGAVLWRAIPGNGYDGFDCLMRGCTVSNGIYPAGEGRA